MNFLKTFFGLHSLPHKPRLTAIEIFKYIGPGLLVTVGFIDPGNWASNIAAGGDYGYKLLWIVTLGTIMLILLQHNAAHLGIATGLCISEAATLYLKPVFSRFILITAMLASVSTALAEILGGAIALKMLFNIPFKIGALLVFGIVVWMLYSNTYRKVEKLIIGFVSLIGISFIIELYVIEIPWKDVWICWIKPEFPDGSMIIIMSVLGAVVMPHNLFLHSEIIQSRQWNLQDEKVIKHQLKFEFADTLISMIIGWAINSAMILVAASVFFTNKIHAGELEQAQTLLTPLVGAAASIIFAVALLFSGISSSITAGMAGGSVYAGIFKEPYDIKDNHSKHGVLITLIGALAIILLLSNNFQALIYSQVFLSLQLPFTIFLLIYLTSSKKIMGKYANTKLNKFLLWTVGIIVSAMNIGLLCWILK